MYYQICSSLRNIDQKLEEIWRRYKTKFIRPQTAYDDDRPELYFGAGDKQQSPRKRMPWECDDPRGYNELRELCWGGLVVLKAWSQRLKQNINGRMQININ